MRSLDRSSRLLTGAAFAFTAVLVAIACGDSGDPAAPVPTGSSGTSASGGTSGTSGTSGGTSGTSGGPAIDAAVPPFDNGGRICTGTVQSTAPDTAEVLTVPAGITPAAGLVIEAIAKVSGGRHITPLPNGDLLVGTQGDSVYLVPHADAAKAGDPVVFATLDDTPVHGVFFHQPSCTVYASGQTSIFRLPYEDGQKSATKPDPIARVRTMGTGGHATTSVTMAGGSLFASVGSSCNACIESDPTRASVQMLAPDGTGMTTYAKRIRNAIALTTNPATNVVWAGVAGQDSLPAGHPYEFFDAVTTHPPGADYGWPDCEENKKAYASGADCSNVVVPAVVFPAFSTLIGAAFYPLAPTGAHALPAPYRGGAIVAAHGSWHKDGATFSSAPRVAFVAMNGDVPAKPVDWTNPTTQWTDLVGGFETADRTARVGRPAGVAVGRDGSVFVTDDDQGLVYRIRPAP
ncbi:MAG: L-sorbosone dehydrogenase [Labilithrix sp.]|nr:L-sorbosone dehydrogenase [Labilithrix sp.]